MTTKVFSVSNLQTNSLGGDKVTVVLDSLAKTKKKRKREKEGEGERERERERERGV